MHGSERKAGEQRVSWILLSKLACSAITRTTWMNTPVHGSSLLPPLTHLVGCPPRKQLAVTEQHRVWNVDVALDAPVLLKTTASIRRGRRSGCCACAAHGVETHAVIPGQTHIPKQSEEAAPVEHVAVVHLSVHFARATRRCWSHWARAPEGGGAPSAAAVQKFSAALFVVPSKWFYKNSCKCDVGLRPPPSCAASGTANSSMSLGPQRRAGRAATKEDRSSWFTLRSRSRNFKIMLSHHFLPRVWGSWPGRSRLRVSTCSDRKHRPRPESATFQECLNAIFIKFIRFACTAPIN